MLLLYVATSVSLSIEILPLSTLDPSVTNLKLAQSQLIVSRLTVFFQLQAASLKFKQICFFSRLVA
ncbi:hypothetical protein AYO28_26035 [Pseudomonas putida]|uniref:Uncharacterized protein n=1 Tax=Pseudomonas putida TaxID=303 RepID=A0A177SC05_PSEPU|nr:hypothetical protein AYO28_26035 [Pseudomonas putida]